MNGSKICSNIKRELSGLKRVGTVDSLTKKIRKERKSTRGLFGVHLLILHFKFQFSIHQIFNISYLTYPLKISLSQNAVKITQNFAQNRQTVVMVISIEI